MQVNPTQQALHVQMGGELESLHQHAAQPRVLDSFPSESWVPPVPADFLPGSLQGSLTTRINEAMPNQPCSQGLANQPAATKPSTDEPAIVAALDLGSLLGPIGDSWMGPFAAAPQAAPEAANVGPVPGMVAAQKPFHMLFPITN